MSNTSDKPICTCPTYEEFCPLHQVTDADFEETRRKLSETLRWAEQQADDTN